MADFGAKKLPDDVMIDIIESSNKTAWWNKDLNKTYNCPSTNERYRVLKQNNRGCPMEARIKERDSLCCTSRESPETDSHPESLEFLRTLRDIYLANPGSPDNMPRHLKRVLGWLTQPSNNSDVLNVEVSGLVKIVDTHNERFLDILKFAMMIKSDIQIYGFGQANDNDISWTRSKLFLNFRISPHLYRDIIRVVNDVATVKEVIIMTNPGVKVDVIPINTPKLYILGSGFVDILDIANHLERGIDNIWNLSEINGDFFGIMRPNTDMVRKLHDIVLHMINQPSLQALQSRKQEVRIVLDGQNVPNGYVPVTFVQSTVGDIASQLKQSMSLLNEGVGGGDDLRWFTYSRNNMKFECGLYLLDGTFTVEVERV